MHFSHSRNQIIFLIACSLFLLLGSCIPSLANIPKPQASGGLDAKLAQSKMATSGITPLTGATIPHGMNLVKATEWTSGRPLQGGNQSLPPANYDEQLGLTYSQNLTSLSYNITAVEQSDAYGYGPAYLLNGLSDKGFWYQVGLSWDWPFSTGGYTAGFNFNYEVYNSLGQSVFPSSGGAGLIAYSGTVNQGDTVLLSLDLSGGQVFMYSHDWNTNATAYQDYSTVGATTFMGLTNSSNLQGFFTGPMTEMYRASAYYGQESKVTFTNLQSSLAAGVMWIDEWDPTTNITLFAHASDELNYSNPGQLQFFSSNGATIGSDSFQFITGATSIFGITMNYTVQAGGTGYSAPTMIYYSNGTQYVTTLSTQAETYYMDNRSSWSVSAQLLGSNAVERWTALQSTGIATSSQSVTAVYDHQFQVTIASNPPGAGTTQPSGSNWFEADSQVQIQAQANNSFTFAEWNRLSSPVVFGNVKSFSTFATISGPGTIDANFGHLAVFLPEYAGNVTEGASKSMNASLIGTQALTTLSISGLPDGATVNFGTNPTIPNLSGETVPVTIATSFSTPPGVYALTIFANSNQGNDSATYTLNVKKAIALTFEVAGGNGLPSLPQLNFTYNGAASSANLTSAPDTVYADYGSYWSVDSILLRSNLTDRWIASGKANGTALNSQTLNLEYFHQYAASFSFQVSDGSSPPKLPQINFTSVGTFSSLNVNRSVTRTWVDAGTSYSYGNMIINNASERWIIGSNQTGKISSPTHLTALYYHQFLLSVAFKIIGGGSSYATPVFGYKNLGATLNQTLQFQTARYWSDAGSNWTAPKLLGGSSTNERWLLANSTAAGQVNSSTSVSFNYMHQFFVRLSADYSQGGSLKPRTGWYNANETVKISENANSGWRFIRWDGGGSVANGTMTVNGPVNETAVFSAAVAISSPSSGDMTYDYGSVHGTVSSGSTTTIFVPPGTTLVFKEMPSSVLYTIGSWDVGNTSRGASPSYTLVVSGPSSVGVALGFNYIIPGIIVGAGVAGAIALFVLKRRGLPSLKASKIQESSDLSD